MKKFFSIICILAFMLTMSCSNDDSIGCSAGKVNAAKDIKFEISFNDYNADDTINHGTRAATDSQMLKPQIVPMGDMMYAEVSLQRDTTKVTDKVEKAKTRALTDGTYTIYAYQGTDLKGTLKGTVASNVFTPTSSNEEIGLVPGTYTFVCCNEKVQVNGETWSVDRADVENARIGIAKNVVVTPTPMKQKVSFQMKHVGSRVAILLQADGFPVWDATADFTSITNIPEKVDFNSATQTFSVVADSPLSENISFQTQSQSKYSFHNVFYAKQNPSNGLWQKEYFYFLPSTNGSKLKLSLTGGTAYRLPLNGRSVVFPALTSMEMNNSYILTMKLHYNYFFLYSDGTIGQKTDANYSHKTPIAVVVSRSKRIAAALNEIDTRTINNYHWGKRGQTTITTANSALNAHLSDLNGYDYTYSTVYSTDGIVKGNDATNYPAFYAAAHYDPGVTVTGANIGKWYLPTIGEWNLYYKNLVLLKNEDLKEYVPPYLPNAWDGYFALYPDDWAIKRTSLPSQIYGSYNQWYYVSASESTQNTYFCYLNQSESRLAMWAPMGRSGKNTIFNVDKDHPEFNYLSLPGIKLTAIRPFIHY